MVIELDEEQEAAMAEAEAEDLTDPVDVPELEIDPEELRLLRLLEGCQRDIADAEDSKKAEMDSRNEGIKELKSNRDGILMAIAEHRLGQRGLPLDD